jgi:integrase
MRKYHALSAVTVEKISPSDEINRYQDGQGLYLEVRPGGGKYWFYRFRFAGKDKRISLGAYPAVSLKEARRKLVVQRQIVADGDDPSRVRKVARLHQNSADQTFEYIAREFLRTLKDESGAAYLDKLRRRLEMYVFPYIGTMNIEKISTKDVLDALFRIKERGTLETAKRTHNVCDRVFRYAMITGRAKTNPVAGLSRALGNRAVRNHAFIKDPARIGELMRHIAAYQGGDVVRHALQLAPLVFVRPGELRQAEWDEIDFDRAVWTIPAAKMKMRRIHVVPLSVQSIAVLKSIKQITGQGRFVFPSARSWKRPMSDGTINAALRTLGYTHEDLTGHGFRHMASTLLNEMGWRADAIELQLAHVERSSVRGTYNHAEHLGQRKEMMQSWANHLFALASGASIEPIRVAA